MRRSARHVRSDSDDLRFRCRFLKALNCFSSRSQEAAANFYLQALDRARQQNALSWELRFAMSLAKLQHGRSRIDEAYRLLSSVYDTEGLETADLREARALMNDHRTDGR